MKEFALKHPILTFLLADTLIGGVVTIVTAIAAGRSNTCYECLTEEEEEEETDEPTGDIQ